MSGQREDEDRPVSFAGKDPERGAHLVAGKEEAPFYKGKLLAAAQAAAQFRFRIRRRLAAVKPPAYRGSQLSQL